MTASLSATAVIGPGGLIESGVRPGRWSLRGRLDAVILDPDGRRLWHYWRAQDRPDQPWLRGEVITNEALGSGTIRWQPGASRRSNALVVDVLQADGLVRYRSTPDGVQQGWERSGLAQDTSADAPEPGLADHRAHLAKQLAARGTDVRGACLARTSLGGRLQA
ncbi:MAG: hypothetical protein WCF12_12150, partial [Propionicimonas sp.]